MATFHCPARGVCGTMVGQRQLSIAPGMACEVQWLGILSNSCILKNVSTWPVDNPSQLDILCLQ